VPVNWRAATRRLLPYLIVSAAGFLLAYVVVFAFVFPSGVVPDDGRVPAVTGLDFVDAQRRLGVAGYTAARGMRRYSARSPEGTVLAQSPKSGTPLSRGEAVTLDVSAGEQTAEVPPVIGASEEQARALIVDAGLEVGTVTTQPSTAVGRGAVAAADPAPGTRVAVPARVSLVVSAGAPAVLVPVLVGRPLDDARRLILAAGLALGQITVDPRAVELPNTVLLQDPGAGESANAGSAVNLTVAGITSGGFR
jgi:serine/threonine-protein kinase